MTEKLLKIIKDEALREINKMSEYNEHADKRNELANLEEINKLLSLP